MALVRCLGCGEVFEARGTTVACPSCGTVMRVTGTGGTATPPGMTSAPRMGRLNVEEGSMVAPQAGQEVPFAVEAAPGGGRWLSDGARMWVWIVVGVLAFGLVIDWFRMKVTPVKKVVDQAQVEQLAHDQALKEVGELREELERVKATTRQSVAVAPSTGGNGEQARRLNGETPPPAATVVSNTSPERVAEALKETAGATSAPAAAAPTTRAVRNVEYARYAALVPAAPREAEAAISDRKIDDAIRRGMDWLADQFARRRLKNVESYDATIFPGADAISVYALLTAGQAIRDDRYRASANVVKDLLDGLKELPMEGGKDTYARSLRISALSVFNRKEDRLQIDADARWLLESSIQGAFTYTKPPAGAQRANGGWDNSNSQYGGLGLWAAAESGTRVPAQFWKDVENHWTESQVKISGGWAYHGPDEPARLTMTCAGATMLMVARDQSMAEGAYTTSAAPLGRPVERALEWLDEGEHTVHIDSGYYGYALYGLERVGLASGYKFFGKHDWYRELAIKALATQQADGSWPASGAPQTVETAFHLLFLSRGRDPIFMGKLRWDGPWANRPRDVAMLCRFAGRALERNVNWQVLGLQRDWTDWTDAPALLITSDQPPQLSDDDVRKLRSYALGGGVVFTQAENGSAAMNAFAAELAKRMFPEYEFGAIGAGHPIYSAMFPQAGGDGVKLMGVSNGARLLMVHSPADLAKDWGARPPGKTEKERERWRPVGSEVGTNIVVYATGRRDLRRRIDPPVVATPSAKPVGTIPVARLKYEGNWDPEPWGWERFSRRFDRETSIALNVKPVEVVALEPKTAPVAHLTGTEAHEFSDAEVKAVKEYVEGGGVLLIDACGGSEAFAESVRKTLLSKAFPDGVAAPVRKGNPLMGAGRAWMAEIPALLTRGDVGAGMGLRVMQVGRGAVVISDLDISSGLVGVSVLGVRGLEPGVAERLVRNVVVWAVWPEGAPEGPMTNE